MALPMVHLAAAYEVAQRRHYERQHKAYSHFTLSKSREEIPKQGFQMRLQSMTPPVMTRFR